MSSVCLLVRAGGKSTGGTVLTRRYLSSSSTNNNNDRLGRTLYRQLIRWCRSTNSLIPLSSFVPPVTLKPPHVEQESLQKLASSSSSSDAADWQYLHDLLPTNSKVESHQMTVPIANANDAAKFFHVVFSMNNQAEHVSPEVFKQRISTAFEALKSLNQLTSELSSIEQQREKHLDRTGVLFHVGQVVQHKMERWRGVITGWQRTRDQTTTTSAEEKLSSLTKKNYGNDDNDKSNVVLEETEGAIEKDDIQYSVILDSGDAHLLGGRRNVDSESGDMVAMQSDLDAVHDESLVRIRSNWTQQKFDRFDFASRNFVPHPMIEFQYPLDSKEAQLTETEPSAESVQRQELGGEIVSGVQEFASKLERRILDVTSCSEARGMGLLTSFRERLSALAHGDVVPDSAFLSATDISQSDLAIYHLRQLFNLTLEMSELLWIRALTKENKERLRFSLGQVVKHRKYGFRGVIVAFDPKAAVDVSHWDGLTEIENAAELPFYHIVPDQNDCIEAFGAERPFRYVCEANLEACPRERSFIDVDMEPEWTRRSDEARYDAPDDARFKYAVDSEEDELTAECLTSIMVRGMLLECAFDLLWFISSCVDRSG
jgi:heat shock protein HspQ